MLARESHVCLLALVGLAVFYGLDRMAGVSRRQSRFWAFALGAAAYSALLMMV